MKKIFSIIGFGSLIMLSFFYTEKIANMIIEKDELMMTIKEKAQEYEIDVVEAITDDKTIIPGLNGLRVSNKESYKQMKKYGFFNDKLLEFQEVSPKNKLNKNFDKYIISGNKEKKAVSLIFLVHEETDIDSIIDVLKEKKVKANFFVDGYWFEKNNDRVYDLINSGYVIGNLSYNLNYNDSAFVWMDTILKRIGKQKQGYCYADKENTENLEICALNKNYTIKPGLILNNNYVKNIKENLTNGSIIALEINNSLNKELPIMINYILSKGYNIENLNELLDEKR